MAAEQSAATEGITGIIQLVADNLKVPGFLLMVPVTAGAGKTNVPDWVYAPIIGNHIFDGILDPTKVKSDIVSTMVRSVKKTSLPGARIVVKRRCQA